MAGALLLFLILLILMFLHPDELEHSRRGVARMLSSGYGHDLVLPALIGGCLLLMWRCAATAMGSLVAIEAKADALHVTDMWGTKRIAWERLSPIEIERANTRISTHRRLIFRGEGRAAKVPVNLTELRDTALPTLVARIEAMRCGAGRPEAPRRPLVHGPAAAAAPTGFGRKRI
jgi:hypothetical protein